LDLAPAVSLRVFGLICYGRANDFADCSKHHVGLMGVHDFIGWMAENFIMRIHPLTGVKEPVMCPPWFPLVHKNYAS